MLMRIGSRAQPSSFHALSDAISRIAPEPIPELCERAPSATRECHIILGNHVRYHGIGEILYAAAVHFSNRYRTRFSERLVPNEINIIVDEFANQELPDYLYQFKRDYPRTRYVLIATEYVTEISLLGVRLAKTFNFFNPLEDWRYALSTLAYRAHMTPTPPYMYSRYVGFVRALAVADLILCTHPAVAETMRLIANFLPGRVSEPLTLYPEISANRIAQDERLRRLAPGFVMTGTLTSFRARTASRLIKTFKKAGIDGPLYQHVAFEASSGFRITGHRVNFGYAADAGAVATEGDVKNYIYNLNPAQRPSWGFSSPMRIQRAIMLGQLPVVTRKFNDHAIEEVALLWDEKVETAQKLWLDATLARGELVERHIAAVGAYDRFARRANLAIEQAMEQMA